MKTCSVLYAQDTPRYRQAKIKAKTDDAATRRVNQFFSSCCYPFLLRKMEARMKLISRDQRQLNLPVDDN
jgi:hypothetical protein